jgi:translation initiation factor 1 (eIF-1/SUI1)
MERKNGLRIKRMAREDWESEERALRLDRKRKAIRAIKENRIRIKTWARKERKGITLVETAWNGEKIIGWCRVDGIRKKVVLRGTRS